MEVVIQCGTCYECSCHVCDNIANKMLPLLDRTKFINGYRHLLLPLQTKYYEGHTEATGMLTMTKTVKLILITNSVVLSPSFNITYTSVF